MKNLKKIVLISNSLILSSVVILTTSSLFIDNKNNISLKFKKIIESFSVKNISYKYDNKIFMDAEIKRIGILSENRINNVSDDPHLPLEIWFGTKGGKETYMISIAPNLLYSNQMPLDYIGMQYTKNSKNDWYKDSFIIDQSNIIKTNHEKNLFGFSISKNLAFANLEGVVQLRNTHSKKNSINPFGIFATQNSSRKYSTFQENFDNNYFPSIGNKNIPNYSMNDKENDEWIRSSIYFAVFDNRLWFTDVSSSIKVTLLNDIDLSQITYSEFMKNVSNYVKLDANNCPKQIMEDAKLDCSIDDASRNIIIKFSTSQSFKPNYKLGNDKNLLDTQWIKEIPMIDTLQIPLSSFKNSNQTDSATKLINESISVANTEFANNFASYFVENNKNKINDLIFDNKEKLFANLTNTFSLKNIIVKNISVIDFEGKIIVDFVLNNYINEFGIHVNNYESQTFEIKINDFLPNDSTLFDYGKNNFIDLGSEAKKYFIYEVNEEIINKFKSTIASKVTNYVGDSFLESDILSIEIEEYIYELGQLKLNVKVKENKAKINGIIQKQPTVLKGLFGQFKFNSETILKNSTISAINHSNELPSDFYKNTSDDYKIASLIFNNRENIYSNLPFDFVIENIKIKEVITDDKLGELKVKFTINNYFDKLGIPKNDEKEFSLAINNFKIISSWWNAKKIVGIILFVFSTISILGLLGFILFNKKQQ